jgi:hypothetical protein
MCAAALLLGPSTCRTGSDERVVEDRPPVMMRLPRISIVVEVDVLGSQAPSIRAEVARYPTPRLP